MTRSVSKKIFSATLLISGTCIGAGMLGVPVLTGPAGLIPCLSINFICFLYMLITGLMFVEAILWSKDGDNILSISKRFLGPIGKLVGGITFLYLYYSLLVSYFSGGSGLIQAVLNQALNLSLSHTQSQVIFLLIFGSIVTLGTKCTDKINAVLFFGLIITFFLLLSIGFSDIDPSTLIASNWKNVLLATPVLFSTYGYHNVLPSIATYTKRSPKVLIWAVLLGASIPFVLYSLWQVFIIATVPAEALEAVKNEGQTVTMAIIKVTKSPSIYWISLFFSFFALVTSFLGVALSMFDFIGDGIGIKERRGIKRIGIALLVFIPSFILSLSFPGIFLSALSIAGGFGEATLNGLLPILMIWFGVYKFKRIPKLKFLSSKKLLWSMLIFTLIIILVELLMLTKVL